MTIVELMAALQQSGVKLSWHGEQLKCQLPKGGIDAQLKQQLIDNKEAVKAFVKAQQEAQSLGSIAKRNLTVAPLSNAQASIWFVDFMQGGSPQFNLPAAFSVAGDFDLDAAEKVLGLIIERHESLRSIFKSTESGPVQYVQSDVVFKLEQYDLSDLSQLEAQNKGREIVINDRDKVFNLQNDLMLRAGFIRLKEKDGKPFGLMFINAHHIVSDGWSMGVLTQEFIAIYDALVKGQPNPLLPLPIQYSDYVMWQREKLEGEQMHSALDYWHQLLSDAPACHHLPMDRPRSDASVKGGIVRSELSHDMTGQLKQLSRATDTTLFMLLQAAFAVHIGRLSCETDVMLGAPNAGRLNQTLESMIGMFVNTQVYRTVFDDNPSFNELLKRTRQQHLDTSRYQHVTFETIVEHVQPVRINHCAPLFQILINFDNADLGDTEIDGLKFSPLDGSDDIDNKYDITLYIFEHNNDAGNTLEFKWVYDARLFEQDTIVMFSREFEHLLSQFAQTPEKPVLAQSWLNPQPVNQVVPFEPDTNVNVMALFEKAATQNPNKTALSFKDKDLSYHTLNRKANQFAHVLSEEYGVQTGSQVAIAIERSEKRIIAMMAVMKLGGCFIPLSDEVPVSRWQKLIELGEAKWLIADDRATQDLSGEFNTDLQLVNVSKEQVKMQVEAASEHNPAQVKLNRDAIAHIIFTSGSTGEPKGVLGTCAALYNRIEWMLNEQPFDADETMIHITSMAFIRSVWELFTPLCAGVRLLLCERDVVRQPDVLWPLMAEQNVTRVVCAPSMMKTLHQIHLMAPLSTDITLRHWYVSGEPMLLADAQSILTSFDNLSLYNLYGSTEVMSAVTCYALNLSQRGHYASIGKPIDGVSIVVENEGGEPVPQGVIGEIVVYGRTVAKGYVQKNLANNGFFESSSSESDHIRGFRTGDYGRVLADGNIECIGRRDDQVKIRGFRIELAEIEHCLGRFEAVSSARVWNVSSKVEPVLAAYAVIGDADPVETKAKLTAYIKQQLPSYMVPAFIVVLDKWPLKANGKVDRSMLPKAFEEHTIQSIVKPKGDVQCLLARIWSELLNLDVETLGVEQDFFALGGHSLMLVSLQGAIRQQLQLSVKVQDLFNFSTIELLAEHIEQLQGTGQSNKVPEIVPVDFSDSRIDGEGVINGENLNRESTLDVPLSFAQQRLWLVDKIQQGSSQYNMPRAFIVKGELDLDALTVAIERIIQRHQTIRTTYVEKGETAVSRIHQHFEFSLLLQDLSALPEAERDNQLRKLILEDAQTCFDLTSDLMLRVSVVQLSHEPQQSCIVFNQHHIASDGWSLNLLCHEFVVQYQAAVRGMSDPLPPLKLQYSDYAYWQRQWLQGEVLKQQLGYWQQQLDDLPQCHNLPLDCQRPQVKGHSGRKYSVQLGPDFSESINELAKRHNVTPFMLLHGALALVFARHSYSQDIVVGTPVANRSQSELADIMGFFVNTLVLRVSTDHDDLPSFLAHVRDVNLAAQDNQDVPFEYLVEQTKVVRSRQYSPLFQILFTVNTLTQVDLEIDGLEIELVEDSETAVKFDLDINVQLNEQGMLLNWVFDTDLFEQSTIEMMCGHWLALLQQMTTNKDGSWQSLPMLSKAHQQQLICQGKTVPEKIAPIHHLFEQRALSNPEHIALQIERADGKSFETMTYSQLNAQANRLAHYLKAKGIGKNAFVALCFERSVHMVISILAALKAGGAYVPVDPSLPQSRREFMLQDTKAKVLLTMGKLASLFSDTSDVNVVIADEIELCEFSEHNPATVTGANSNDLAYVIYTSGSTGMPKGVMMGHGGLSNRLDWMQREYALTDQDKVLQKTPYGFDVSVWEFLWTLGYGATLVLAKPEGHKDPAYLQQLIEQTQVSVMHFVPSMLSTYLAQPDAGFAKSVRCIFCSGEALTPAQVKSLNLIAPFVALHNLYGPTEAAIDVSYFDCAQLNGKDSVPIGRAIQNVELLVLDNQMNITPQGAVGQLYIGGVALAQGYLNRPELTAETFVTHPFSDEPNKKIYRTGDLVKLVADEEGGEPLLVYLGRADNQLKIRGFRVELGEIEQQLQRLPQVDSALVISKTLSDDNTLVAYVKPADINSEEANLKAEIKEALADILPEYMCPEHYIFMAEWPLTHNGKLDRKALPEPDLLASQGAYVAPSGETEVALVDIWSTLLSIEAEAISANANFFGLGGHSLLAARMIAQVRLQLGVEIGLNSVFDHPELSSLADVILKADKSDSDSGIEVNQEDHQVGAVGPASFAQQRLWFIQQLNPQSSEYHIPAAMRLKGQFDLDIAGLAISEIINRHLSLRTSFYQQDDEVMQRIEKCEPFSLMQYDLSGTAKHEQREKSDELIAQLHHQPFDLSGELLLRAAFIKLGQDEGILALTVHHIAADGWSMSNLSDEFVQLYRAIQQGKGSPLAPLNVQYIDFAKHQKQWLADEHFAEQRQYWVDLLAGAPASHQLPLDKPRDASKAANPQQLEHFLSQEQLERLQSFLNESNTTLFMFMQCALALHIGRLSGQTDVVLGAPNGGRDNAELEPLIGLFLNTQVYRTEFSDNPSVKDLLAQTKAQHLASNARQHVPFEAIVEAVNPPRELAITPIFQVLINSVNFDSASEQLDDLTIEPINNTPQNKYDLTLYLNQLPDGDKDKAFSMNYVYDGNLLEQSTMALFAAELDHLMAQMVNRPETPVLNFSWQNQAEVIAGPQTPQQTASLAAMFENTVKQKADSVAYVDDNLSLTYQELNEKANQLSRVLAEDYAVGKGDVIAVATMRNANHIIALLALVKLGACYLPLTDELPQARLEHMLDTGEVKQVLTEQAFMAVTSIIENYPHLLLDSDSVLAAIESKATANLELVSIAQDDAAHIIFTSGTTGLPKGVQGTYGACANRINWMLNSLKFEGSYAAMCHITAFGFIRSVWELLTPLCGGVRLVMCQRELLLQPDVFAQYLRQHQVTAMVSAPSLLSAIVGHGISAEELPLKQWFVSGEPLLNALAKTATEHFSHTRFYNLYGSTEVMSDVLCYELNEQQLTSDENAQVSIGQPIDNVEVAVLGPDLQVLPAGVLGELVIFGDALANGYLADNQGNFVTTEWGRGYRTGDLAKIGQDGLLYCHGRIDDQVQIRGHRVELAEIEHQLLKKDEVKAAKVLAVENHLAELNLVAYLQLYDSAGSPDELQQDISSKLQLILPSYMLPSQFIVLDNMPLRPNGKVDKHKLPSPEPVTDTSQYIAPETSMEIAMSEIWSGLLNIDAEKISREADFFALGGHSLLTIKLISAIKARFEVEPQVKTVFEHKTLSALAQSVEQAVIVKQSEEIHSDTEVEEGWL